MLTTFPIHINLQNRSCLIIGGGKIAVRRANQLLAAGARISLVHPRRPAALQTPIQEGLITFYPRSFRPEDTRGMVLVMNTFNSTFNLSRVLFRLAMRRGFLLNCHDQPQFSTFIMPALIQRGGLQIGISTGGMSPSISKRLKEDLEKIFDQEFEKYFEWVASRRSEIFKGRSSKKNRYPRLQKFLEDFKLSGKIQYPGRWKKES